MAQAVHDIKDLNKDNLQEILQSSLASNNIKVISIQDPGSDLGSKNDQFASILKKVVVVICEDGVERKLHMVAKSALEKGVLAKLSKLGWFIFTRESLWFKTVLPMLLENLSADQSESLQKILPKCYYAYSNYEDTDRDDFMFRNILLCFCCIIPCRKRERGIILMENLKESKYVDMKEIEKKGVTAAHMKLALDGLANLHGAWWLWLQKADKVTRQEICSLYKTQAVKKWEWPLKMFVKVAADICIDMLETRKENPEIIEKLKNYKNSAQTVKKMVKGMYDFEESKFKTMIHWDLWTPQLMFSHKDDGSPDQVKILDYQTLSLGHPATDIWKIVYTATDSNFRTNNFEECLKSYFSILSTYMTDLEDTNYEDFKEEVEARRSTSPLIDGFRTVLTLAPDKRPDPMNEKTKFIEDVKKDLNGPDSEDHHPDVKEMRRRVMDLVKECYEQGLLD